MIRIETEALLTPTQAAAYLGVTDRTLWNWRANGIGPDYLDLGPRHILYRVEDIREYADERAA